MSSVHKSQQIKATSKFCSSNFTMSLLHDNARCIECVVVQWCNPLTLQPEHSDGMGSRRGRASPLERHDKGSRTRLAPSYFCDPNAWL